MKTVEMLRANLILVLLAVVLWSSAQIIKPIGWDNQISGVDPEGMAIISFHAIIDADWYLNSSDFDPDLGPNVTEFIFDPHESYELIGTIEPHSPLSAYDATFGGTYTYFKKKAT